MNRRIALRAAAAALLAGATARLHAQVRDAELTVFAAASLQDAFEAVGKLYRQRTGRAVKFSFAASSALARQIEQGAPAAVFASADQQWMDYLAQRNLIVGETRKPLLGNRLVLVVPAANTAKVELKPGVDLAALLGKEGRWVTGDPSNVPVGRYAQEALTRLGTWEFAQTRLVRTENVRVALAFVERGEAAAGVVYATDAAMSPNVRVAGIFPEDSHTPITYPIAAVGRHDSPAARDFLRLLESPEARDVFRKFGFTTR
jgi:molybdate transport system substrate-binding protein